MKRVLLILSLLVAALSLIVFPTFASGSSITYIPTNSLTVSLSSSDYTATCGGTGKVDTSIGTTLGSADVYQEHTYNDFADFPNGYDFIRDGISLTLGQTYYVGVYCESNGAFLNIASFVYRNPATPGGSFITYTAPNSLLNYLSSTDYSGTCGGAGKVDTIIGTTAGASDVYQEHVYNDFADFPNGYDFIRDGISLTAGNTYYVGVYCEGNAAVLNIDSFVYTPASNQAPVVGTITASPNPVQVSTATVVSANFTDADSSDTHTAVWNWGDNTSLQNGTVTESNGSGSVSDSHTYTAAGVYQVTLTVTDNHGGVGTQVFQYISVYNPTSQGLFSAGQKYTSPAGALTQDLSATGAVKFGLSYKYQGTIPVCTRQFSMDFNSANFHFNATAVNTLVINNGTGTLTGTGTVNGSGTYSFLVTGSESSNTIRIQIKDSFNNIIYDTQAGAANNATPTTAVNGHILAH